MLYVPSRPKNSNNVEDVEISTRGATRNEGESDGSPGADSVTFNNVKQGKPQIFNDDVMFCTKKEGILSNAPAVGVVNDNVLPRSSTELSGRDATPRPHNVHDDGHEAKSNIDDVPSSQAVSQREDHEDGDRDDLYGKAESKGEAEGIEDANIISVDGTYSDHILLSAKPLAKHVASLLHDGGKKDCNIFYENESFYALFQLHQVAAECGYAVWAQRNFSAARNFSVILLIELRLLELTG
ncbi:paired amphipathic helix protein Sin3-like protein 2 isoform X3 [Tanacetum coccineum]|uniref:Paired amphipathic helix protein Sin3-like protein 2 isoform X3 n=1 Tax=Tanacetum coccineum TaxID=301880 RepID=A0ABQ5F874_9ASTR